MKLIIDVPEEVYEALKGIAEDATSLDPYSLADIIVNKSESYEERPQAEWLYFEGVSTSGYLECSKCGETDFHKRYSNFCPNCGKYMKNRKGGVE